MCILYNTTLTLYVGNGIAVFSDILHSPGAAAYCVGAPDDDMGAAYE